METPVTPPPKERRWPIALLVGFVSAIVAVVAVVPIADWGMEEHHVSNMEGGRGYAMVFCWMPLALIVAFGSGFVVSLLVAGRGFVGYLKRQGIALGVVALLFGIGAALSYSTADHPPLIDGKGLALEIEVRVPAKGRSAEQLKEERFDIALVVSASDRNYSEMRWDEARPEGEFIVIPAWAVLYSRNAGREITAGVADENRQIIPVLLPPSPKQIDEAWSEWQAATRRFDATKPAGVDQYSARYRVRFATEYSPTPHPHTTQPGTDTATTESAADEESPSPSPEESP